MTESLRRPLLTGLFLLALIAWNSLWVLVGEQYHLDLMFWAWKLGLVVTAAGLTVWIAVARGKRALAAAVLLLACLLAAGFVTYYVHLNEPADADETGDQVTRLEWSAGSKIG